MRALKQPRPFFMYVIVIIIIALASCLGDDTQSQPRDFLGDPPCPPCVSRHVCQPCRTWQVFQMRDRRCNQRHVTWRSVTCSPRRRRYKWCRPQTKPSPSSALTKTGSRDSVRGSRDSARPAATSVANNRTRDFLSSFSAAYTSPTFWFLGNGGSLGAPFDAGLERSVVAVAGRKSVSWVGLALLLLHILPHVIVTWFVKQLSAWICCRKGFKSKHNSRKSLNRLFLYQLKPDFLYHQWRSIPHVSGTNKTKDMSKQKIHPENRIEEIMSKLSKTTENNAPDFIPYNIFEEVQRSSFSNSIETLTVQPLSIPRLASYQRFPLVTLPGSISFVLLAQAGFKYSGRGTLVCCEGCSSTFEVVQVGKNPYSQRYHAPSCEFQGEAESPGSAQAADVTETLGTGITQAADVTQALDAGIAQAADVTQTLGAGITQAVDVSETLSAGITQAADVTNTEAIGSTPGKQTQASATHAISSNSNGVFVAGSRYSQDAEMTTRHFYGADLFEAEFSREQQKPFRPDRVNVGDCEKNPGHFGYWSPVALTSETVPEFAACRQFCQFLGLVAELTVRVVVGHTSPARGISIESLGHSKGDKYRTGTGSAIREPLFDTDDTLVECDAELTHQVLPSPLYPGTGKTNSTKSSKTLRRHLPKAPLKAVRRYASSLKKTKSTLYIETNRHIVFDDAEAAETSVEFYFDRADRRSVFSFRATRVLHDVSLEGGNRSFLVCRTSDHSFVQSLRAKRRQLELLVGQFPSAVREALLKHVFVVHHPHGGEKVYSFGKSVVRKYFLEPKPPTPDPAGKATSPGGASRSRLTKIADLKQIPSDVSTARKLLLYTADTCRGSSGAPVIAFTHTGSDADGTPSIALSLWMHEGKEVNGLLNVSAMEACTAADLAPRAPRARPQPVTLALPMPGPVIRMQNPTYYVYSSLRKRLESFSCVLPHTFVHSILELAKGGFFYAGYGDCVRCFYCGVGLKRWALHDDLYVEHEKRRPDCHFLMLQLRAMGATRRARPAAIAASQSETASAAQNPSELQFSVCAQPLPPCFPPRPVSSEMPSCFDYGKPELNTSYGLVPCQSQLEVAAYPVTEVTFTNSTRKMQGQLRRDPHSTLSVTPDMSAANTSTGSAVASSDIDKTQFQLTMLQTENAILERPLMCKVCNSAPVREIYLPCGHLDSCSECTQALDNCPTCCARVKATVKIYFT